MELITDTETLAAFCDRLSSESFVTVDTEFMREKTYWPKLCLVQLGGSDDARCVDVLANGIDLQPLFDLMANEDVLKVFHAARQDVEIFVKLTGKTPVPMFDSQVAAMVCGFGESVGYETLVNNICRESLDKGSRFTDWSKRPLTERQVTYALGDVTYLREIYQFLKDKLDDNNRAVWLEEEMAALTSTDTYIVDPNMVWKRLKARTKSTKVLAVLREVAAWREREAQRKDMPRNRVIRDDAIIDIAHQSPKDTHALERVRGLNKSIANGRYGKEILEAIQQALSLDPSEHPKPPAKKDLPKGLGPVVDLLKVLLKYKSENFDVAQKLIANVSDLEQVAAYGDGADVACLKGWRREMFGEDALKLKAGGLALAVNGKNIKVIDLDS
ncbi:Ribonuclease D [Candidatus Terasakiella magnetica]|uniref:Ribonuclease D n=1 Tax=Candidatus Terasakiella magnetica TaxID=1867952 RepID=A0A1C3RDP4_9PROT|nr:ribonuclease D [Candidatus Terasakiella magnetica]SCA55351.1 Ribonuclease D [Candidatus Terasakiella magnetica]